MDSELGLCQQAIYPYNFQYNYRYLDGTFLGEQKEYKRLLHSEQEMFELRNSK